jgi:ADP-heptose:LPS heptosyltransferase
MNILILRLSSMGDVVLATSVFDYVNGAFPGSKIWFVTDAKFSGLFEHDPRIVRVVSAEKNREGEAAKVLRNLEWDRIIDLQNSARGRRIYKGLSVKKAPSIFEKLHWERTLLLLLRVDLYPKGDHVAGRYAQAAGAPRTTADVPPARIIIDEKRLDAAKRSMLAISAVRPTIALFPFSAWKNKEWPAARWVFVGRYFAVKGWNVMIAGGPEDKDAAGNLASQVGDGCFSIAGTLPLYDTACCISMCRLALGNDTGLSHLARACGVKTGVIFGPTTAHFGFFPYGAPPFRVFEAKQVCRPCHAHGGSVCFAGSRPCLRKITPEIVIAGLEELAGITENR